MSRATAPSPPATPLLRGCVLVAALASLGGLVGSGLIGAASGLLVLPLVLAGAAAPWLSQTAQLLIPRRVGAVFVVVVAALTAFALDRSVAGDGVAALPVDLGPRLAVVAIGLLIAQLMLGDRQRELLVALLLSLGLLVFAVAAGPGIAVGVALAVAWPAVVGALAIAVSSTQRAAADVVAEPVDHPRASVTAGPVVVVVVGSVLIGLLFALLGPQPEGVRPPGARAAGDSESGPGGDQSGSVSRDVRAYTHGALDLRGRGELPETVVAEVPADSPSLWRGTTLSTYDGTTWRSTGSGTGPALAGGPRYPLAPDVDAAGGPLRTDRLRIREGFGGVLLAPGLPTAVDVDGTVLPINGGYFLGAKASGGAYPSSYVVTAGVTEQPAATLRTAAAHPATQASAPESYTVVPASVPERVRSLGRRLTAGAATRYDAMVAVEQFLRRHATYRLDSPVPPPGVDAVDHFLFSARTGFCEQFASAGVLLLRSAGIPARLATGFSGDDADGDGEWRTLRESNAHAWVEVHYPNVGWVASDPTAGTELADSTSWLNRLEKLLQDARGRAIVAGLLIGLCVGVSGATWLSLRVVRGVARRRWASRLKADQPPVLAAFDRLDRALATTGQPRAPTESVAELARRPQLRPAAGALAVVERTCYSRVPPGLQDSDVAVRELDALVEALTAKP